MSNKAERTIEDVKAYISISPLARYLPILGRGENISHRPFSSQDKLVSDSIEPNNNLVIIKPEYFYGVEYISESDGKEFAYFWSCDLLTNKYLLMMYETEPSHQFYTLSSITEWKLPLDPLLSLPQNTYAEITETTYSPTRVVNNIPVIEDEYNNVVFLVNDLNNSGELTIVEVTLYSWLSAFKANKLYSQRIDVERSNEKRSKGQYRIYNVFYDDAHENLHFLLHGNTDIPIALNERSLQIYDDLKLNPYVFIQKSAKGLEFVSQDREHSHTIQLSSDRNIKSITCYALYNQLVSSISFDSQGNEIGYYPNIGKFQVDRMEVATLLGDVKYDWTKW